MSRRVTSVERQTVSGSGATVTIIHRATLPNTVLQGQKPHIFRQNGRWRVFGQRLMTPSDFYRLSAFLIKLNQG